MSLLLPRMTGYGMDGSPPQINDFFTTSWSMTMLAYTYSGALVSGHHLSRSWPRDAGSREILVESSSEWQHTHGMYNGQTLYYIR
jgi:hypothetical protein